MQNSTDEVPRKWMAIPREGAEDWIVLLNGDPIPSDGADGYGGGGTIHGRGEVDGSEVRLSVSYSSGVDEVVMELVEMSPPLRVELEENHADERYTATEIASAPVVKILPVNAYEKVL